MDRDGSVRFNRQMMHFIHMPHICYDLENPPNSSIYVSWPEVTFNLLLLEARPCATSLPKRGPQGTHAVLDEGRQNTRTWPH